MPAEEEFLTDSSLNMPQPFEDTAGVERLLDDVGAWSLQEDVAQWLTKLSTVPADILDVATAAEDSWTRHFVVAHYNKMTVAIRGQ